MPREPEYSTDLQLTSALYLRLKKVFKIEKRGTFWAFCKSSLLQRMKKMKGREHFGDIEEEFSEKK